jgi:hypothetical protein
MLETLGFVFKVGTCHYEFFQEKQGFENGLFSPFLVIFCLHRCISTPSNGGSKSHHGFENF